MLDNKFSMFSFFTNKVLDIFQSLGKSKTLSEQEKNELSEKIQDTLLLADVPMEITKTLATEIIEDVEKNTATKVTLDEKLKSAMYHKIVDLMGNEAGGATNVDWKNKKKILMVGLQGAGKTTTIPKLAKFFKEECRKTKILATSLDFVRPAAVEQLQIVCEKHNLDFFPPSYGNLEQTIEQVLEKFRTEKYEMIILDTPGRLHIDSAMMENLRQIETLFEPDMTLLTIDSMIGQESLKVAQAFCQAITVSGAILTKADSDAKGGVALSLFKSVQKPVYFVTTGEKVQDFEKFIPSRVVGRLLGSGDIASLVEKIDKVVSAEQKENSKEKLLSGNFSLQDFLEQMEMMSNFGSIQKLMSYIPGFSGIPKAELEKAELELKKFRAAILSMTQKERENPAIINPSRKKRIADGSGLNIKIIEELLNKFEESKRFAKLLGRGSMKDMFR